MPELLIQALDDLEACYLQAKTDSHFQRELKSVLQSYGGRPTPLLFAKNLSEELTELRESRKSSALRKQRKQPLKIYIKNEGILHTGAHKLNNVLGQALLCMRMGKRELVAETGAGQHGLAVASVAAKFKLAAKIFMGEEDYFRQYPNVYAMKNLGAKVIMVSDGTRRLKDAVNAAMKYWIENLKTTHYLLGSALGPFPYPLLVRDFQSVIGVEAKKQLKQAEGRLPDLLCACVGGGSNSLGFFTPFLSDAKVAMLGIEAGGKSMKLGEHASRMKEPKLGIVQGYKSYFIQNADGQVQPTHSISAGLDYPGIAPELAYLHQQGRVKFLSASDKEALEGFRKLSEKEGISPALECAHVIGKLPVIIQRYPEASFICVNISGRGDKDIFITAKHLDKDAWREFLKRELRSLR